MSQLIIGLTGGIGSGKTAASTIFGELGIDVIDADICSRVVVEKGQPALEKIAHHFGKNILLADGNLDRASLRARIFKNPEEKKWLEALLHPLIYAEMIRQLQEATSPYAILVSPLLAEAGQKGLCHRVLVIDVSEDKQLQRTMARDNNSQQQVESMMKTQISRTDRLKIADDIIVNDGTFDELREKILTQHQKYLDLAKHY